jgi:6-phosphogluconolactonase
MTAEFRSFADSATLLDSLTGAVGDLLDQALAARDRAGLVVSGGRTPGDLFRRLALKPLRWRDVTVTLADERWVPPGDPASNEGLVRRTLLGDPPGAQARFIPLYTGDETPEAGEAACARALAALPRPIDLVMLGMGDDGHTASLFPDAPTLGDALTSKAPCLAMRPPGAPQARMTLTLPTLLDSRRIILLITGASKRQTLEQALTDGPVEDMPVRAILRQDRVPVEIWWAA